MELNIKLDHLSKTPLFLQITEQIINEIKIGKLKPEMRLPAERKLAAALGKYINCTKKGWFLKTL